MGAALEAGSSLPWAAALDATSRFTGFANNEGVRCHAFSYTLRDGTRVCSSPRLPLLYHARGHVSQLDPRRPLLPAALPRAAHIRRASPGPRIPFRDRGVVASSRSRLRSSSLPAGLPQPAPTRVLRRTPRGSNRAQRRVSGQRVTQPAFLRRTRLFAAPAERRRGFRHPTQRRHAYIRHGSRQRPQSSPPCSLHSPKKRSLQTGGYRWQRTPECST